MAEECEIWGVGVEALQGLVEQTREGQSCSKSKTLRELKCRLALGAITCCHCPRQEYLVRKDPAHPGAALSEKSLRDFPSQWQSAAR